MANSALLLVIFNNIFQKTKVNVKEPFQFLYSRIVIKNYCYTSA
jgi:hypothetical protein